MPSLSYLVKRFIFTLVVDTLVIDDFRPAASHPLPSQTRKVPQEKRVCQRPSTKIILALDNNLQNQVAVVILGQPSQLKSLSSILQASELVRYHSIQVGQSPAL